MREALVLSNLANSTWKSLNASISESEFVTQKWGHKLINTQRRARISRNGNPCFAIETPKLWVVIVCNRQSVWSMGAPILLAEIVNQDGRFDTRAIANITECEKSNVKMKSQHFGTTVVLVTTGSDTYRKRTTPTSVFICTIRTANSAKQNIEKQSNQSSGVIRTTSGVIRQER